MAFKVNVQGAFAPLLDAVNATKINGDSKIIITYSLGSVLENSAKGESAFKSGLSYIDFTTDLHNAFNLWGDLLSNVYQKNSRNKGALQVSFKQVDTESDITIEAKRLSKGIDVDIALASIYIDPSTDWAPLRAVKGYNMFNYLAYSIGRLLGVSSSSGDSFLNPNLLDGSLMVRFKLNIDSTGTILNPLVLSNPNTVGLITSSYGNNKTSLPLVYGCTDIKASNYNSLSTSDDGSCLPSKQLISPKVVSLENARTWVASATKQGVFVGHFVGMYSFVVGDDDVTLPITITPTTSCIFYSDEGLESLYMVIDSYGNAEVFNFVYEAVATAPPKEEDALSYYLDPQLTEGNPAVLKYGSSLVGVHNGVYKHKVDVNANLLDEAGNIVLDCDTLRSFGDYVEKTLVMPTRLMSTDTTAGTVAGFGEYANFLGSKDLSGSPVEIGLFDALGVYMTPVESKKLSSFKSWTPEGYKEVVVLFDAFSSTLFAVYGDASASSAYLMTNGVSVGDGTYDHRYSLGLDSSGTLGASSGELIISTFKGFSFDTNNYGIYSISGKKWDTVTSTLSLEGTTAVMGTGTASNHGKFNSQLPVVIGGKLFEDTGNSKHLSIGVGGTDSLGLYGDETAYEGNEFGYYNVAYALKHGLILMRMYSQSPLLIRPADGGIELHICGGDPTDAGVISSGGYTPISMAFSKDNNYLYAILRDPDTMDTFIATYPLTSLDGATISESVHMMPDPIPGGASSVTVSGDSVFFTSKDSDTYMGVSNADTYTAVLNLYALPEDFVDNNFHAMNYLPSDIERAISKTDDISIDSGEYTAINNYELSSFIATPRGVLNANTPTEPSTALAAGDDEWYGSATANDTAGNILLTAAITSSNTAVLWDRAGNVLQEITIGTEIQYYSDNAISITPLPENKFEVTLMTDVDLLESLYSLKRYTHFTSLVEFVGGESTLPPLNIDMGTASEFFPNGSTLVKGLSFTNEFIPGNLVLSQSSGAAVAYAIWTNGSNRTDLSVSTYASNMPNFSTVFGDSNKIEGACFSAYTDASVLAVGFYLEDHFEVKIVNIESRIPSITKSMSTEAIGAFNAIAVGNNFNIARIEFSQNKEWLYVLLRDKELDVANNTSKIVKINIINDTILAENVSIVQEFFYDMYFIGQEVPANFTSNTEGVYDYTDLILKANSHLSGMFKAADGNIYTTFVNNGTVLPTLGTLINQNNAVDEVRHAPASIRLSDDNMSLGIYSASLDLADSKVVFTPSNSGPKVPLGTMRPGCTSPAACNYDPDATYGQPGSCIFPEEGCECDEPLAYDNCGCYAEGEAVYNTVYGVDYEPCEYCPLEGATNYVANPSASQTAMSFNMCIVPVCFASEEPTACNGLTSEDMAGNTTNYIHDVSKCFFPSTGCECSGSTGLQNITENGTDTHCVTCSDYSADSPGPNNPDLVHAVCGCGPEPVIEGWCNCDTPMEDACDCDGNTNEGYCNECSGDTPVGICDCDGLIPEDLQFTEGGLSGACDCNSTQPVVFYLDLEGDGLGDPAIYKYYCENDLNIPSEWVLNNTDTNINCAYDEDFLGYWDYSTGSFYNQDTDAAGVCSGPSFINGCGDMSTNAGDIEGLNEHGCCGDRVIDCFSGDCVLPFFAVQNALGSEGCGCGYLKSNSPGCTQCVPAEDVDIIYECGCYDIPEGECDCSGHTEDECGVCNGGNLSCAGCMEEGAVNYDPNAIVPAACNYLTLGQIIDEDVITSNSSITVALSNMDIPYALTTDALELDFSTLSSGYTTETIEGQVYFLDTPTVTTKCQVISLSNTTLVCSNPIENAEILYTVTGADITEGLINNPSYSTVNVPTGSVAQHVPTYYFRVLVDIALEMTDDMANIVFGEFLDKIHSITDPSGYAVYSAAGGSEGLIDTEEFGECVNTGVGSPEVLPIHKVYAVTPLYNEAAGKYYEFELDFSSFIPITVPCNGESPLPICCESSGVENPGSFTTNEFGELIANEECEVCGGTCIPLNSTTVDVCCDQSAINAVEDYSPELHNCVDAVCAYDTEALSGLRIELTIHTEGLLNLDGLKWVLLSKGGSLISQSSPINIGQAVNGVIYKEIQLPSSSECLWFLPIGFDNNDIWRNVSLEIKSTTVSYAVPTSTVSLHALTYGASPTPGGSVKINLGSSSCTLGCDSTTLQTEYCESYVREDYTEFTDIILQVNTSGGPDDAFVNTIVEVININTGSTLSYLETLSPTSEYVKTFRVISDTKVGIKVINPDEGALTYKLFSEFGDIITHKKV